MTLILIVEDDKPIATALETRLVSFGFETVSANDANSAAALTDEIRPDLAILDIFMPGGDGFLIAEELQGLFGTDLPIIFITASANPILRDKAQWIGAAGFFHKPYDSGELLKAINAALH